MVLGELHWSFALLWGAQLLVLSPYHLGLDKRLPWFRLWMIPFVAYCIVMATQETYRLESLTLFAAIPVCWVVYGWPYNDMHCLRLARWHWWRHNQTKLAACRAPAISVSGYAGSSILPSYSFNDGELTPRRSPRLTINSKASLSLSDLPVPPVNLEGFVPAAESDAFTFRTVPSPPLTHRSQIPDDVLKSYFTVQAVTLAITLRVRALRALDDVKRSISATLDARLASLTESLVDVRKFYSNLEKAVTAKPGRIGTPGRTRRMDYSPGCGVLNSFKHGRVMRLVLTSKGAPLDVTPDPEAVAKRLISQSDEISTALQDEAKNFEAEVGYWVSDADSVVIGQRLCTIDPTSFETFAKCSDELDRLRNYRNVLEERAKGALASLVAGLSLFSEKEVDMDTVAALSPSELEVLRLELPFSSTDDLLPPSVTRLVARGALNDALRVAKFVLNAQETRPIELDLDTVSVFSRSSGDFSEYSAMSDVEDVCAIDTDISKRGLLKAWPREPFTPCISEILDEKDEKKAEKMRRKHLAFRKRSRQIEATLATAKSHGIGIILLYMVFLGRALVDYDYFIDAQVYSHESSTLTDAVVSPALCILTLFITAFGPIASQCLSIVPGLIQHAVNKFLRWRVARTGRERFIESYFGDFFLPRGYYKAIIRLIVPVTVISSMVSLISFWQPSGPTLSWHTVHFSLLYLLAWGIPLCAVVMGVAQLAMSMLFNGGALPADIPYLSGLLRLPRPVETDTFVWKLLGDAPSAQLVMDAVDAILESNDEALKNERASGVMGLRSVSALQGTSRRRVPNLTLFGMASDHDLVDWQKNLVPVLGGFILLSRWFLAWARSCRRKLPVFLMAVITLIPDIKGGTHVVLRMVPQRLLVSTIFAFTHSLELSLLVITIGAFWRHAFFGI